MSRGLRKHCFRVCNWNKHGREEKALKHHKFARASRKIKLMKHAGKSNKDLEKELEILKMYSSDFCLKHQRSSPRPTVCLSFIANQFNELIAIELKMIKGKWVLHIVLSSTCCQE